jgi:hypothetical protein
MTVLTLYDRKGSLETLEYHWSEWFKLWVQIVWSRLRRRGSEYD